MRKSLLGLLVAGALAGFSVPSWAAPTTCPAVGRIGAGCNTLITITAGGTATVTVPNANPYDGVEDTLVGIQNNSASAISSVTVTGSGIAGFDGDGAFGIGSNCVASGANT